MQVALGGFGGESYPVLLVFFEILIVVLLQLLLLFLLLSLHSIQSRDGNILIIEFTGIGRPLGNLKGRHFNNRITLPQSLLITGLVGHRHHLLPINLPLRSHLRSHLRNPKHLRAHSGPHNHTLLPLTITLHQALILPVLRLHNRRPILHGSRIQLFGLLPNLLLFVVLEALFRGHGLEVDGLDGLHCLGVVEAGCGAL